MHFLTRPLYSVRANLRANTWAIVAMPKGDKNRTSGLVGCGLVYWRKSGRGGAPHRLAESGGAISSTAGEKLPGCTLLGLTLPDME